MKKQYTEEHIIGILKEAERRSRSSAAGGAYAAYDS